jgi:hypothetical protein
MLEQEMAVVRVKRRKTIASILIPTLVVISGIALWWFAR